MKLGSYVVAFCAAQTCAALAIGDQFRMVVQEATGIFANIDLTIGGQQGPRLFEGEGKNRTLNDIVRDISEEDDILDIKSVKLDPEQPKRSSPIHLNALAYVKESIPSATANVKVKYGFLTLLNRNYDLCKELKNNLNRTCPVDEGLIDLDIDIDIPGFIPPGWFHLDAVAWRDSDEKQLGHIRADVRF
ncbi:Phosphatidylglycerol/phosphatidylinositol transfer protein [Coemansia sp. RSA 2399]|nr:Phosphatidylglycerol/phosphatidylinositol transfer protein [Coemansia sp. RSA 2399]KAJ1903738.1 Phosphatidylglycerol/phosphatidylinositol transfer protein [Coemansia sp. IMI 209127]